MGARYRSLLVEAHALFDDARALLAIGFVQSAADVLARAGRLLAEARREVGAPS